MKKIIVSLLVAGLFFSNILGQRRETIELKEDIPSELNKKDWAKIISASVGGAYLLASSAFLAYKKWVGYKKLDSSFNFLIPIFLPLALLEHHLGYNVYTKDKEDEITRLAMVISGFAGTGLAYYLYKKVKPQFVKANTHIWHDLKESLKLARFINLATSNTNK